MLSGLFREVSNDTAVPKNLEEVSLLLIVTRDLYYLGVSCWLACVCSDLNRVPSSLSAGILLDKTRGIL